MLDFSPQNVWRSKNQNEYIEGLKSSEGDHYYDKIDLHVSTLNIPGDCLFTPEKLINACNKINCVAITDHTIRGALKLKEITSLVFAQNFTR